MDKFRVHTGVAAPMLQSNIDTDAIIPSREMKRVSKQGLGEGLFAGWRYTLPGGREIARDFVLNQPQYQGTSILLAGNNFGCGSSREHAVWALKEYGIKAIIASGFGSIFFNNCIRNGILPVKLDVEEVETLAKVVEQNPVDNVIEIDLVASVVKDTAHHQFSFELLQGQKSMLLEGLDAIDVTLKLQDKIDAFQTRYRQEMPWLN